MPLRASSRNQSCFSRRPARRSINFRISRSAAIVFARSSRLCSPGKNRAEGGHNGIARGAFGTGELVVDNRPLDPCGGGRADGVRTRVDDGRKPAGRGAARPFDVSLRTTSGFFSYPFGRGPRRNFVPVPAASAPGRAFRVFGVDGPDRRGAALWPRNQGIAALDFWCPAFGVLEAGLCRSRGVGLFGSR